MAKVSGGEAVVECVDAPSIKAEVLAKNVDQDCYTTPDFSRIKAKPLKLVGCKEGQVRRTSLISP